MFFIKYGRGGIIFHPFDEPQGIAPKAFATLVRQGYSFDGRISLWRCTGHGPRPAIGVYPAGGTTIRYVKTEESPYSITYTRVGESPT